MIIERIVIKYRDRVQGLTVNPVSMPTINFAGLVVSSWKKKEKKKNDKDPRARVSPVSRIHDARQENAR